MSSARSPDRKSFNSSRDRKIVIIGGGIIGCTTAYYISRHPSFSPTSSTITIIEASAHGVAQGASGKAGGLVAKWADPIELAKVSFKEHAALAKEHNGKDRWGWRLVGCGEWEGRGEPVDEMDSHPRRGEATDKQYRKVNCLPDDLLWVKEHLTDSYSPIAPAGETAQVHPYLFTTAMLEFAKQMGVILLGGKATSINKSEGKVTGVTYSCTETQETKTIPATHVLLSAGAWSPTLLSTLPITTNRVHSITIRPRPTATIAPYVLFTKIKLPSSSGENFDPEIYPRPDNEVYATGRIDDSPLPAVVDDVPVDRIACENIHEHVSSISLELREGTVEKHQACFLPFMTVDGGPIVGEARKIAKNLFIATGHSCWGISNAPGTAKAVSELLIEGKVRCVNLKKLDPSRYL